MVAIEIFEVKEVKTQDGKKFNAYTAITKTGRKITCKFTKDVKNLPVKPCTIIAPDDAVNVSLTSKYPTLWVHAVDDIRETVRKSNARDYFDGVEELPG